MWGTFLSEPLSIVDLVGRYPAYYLMERIPIVYRNTFNHVNMRTHDAILY